MSQPGTDAAPDGWPLWAGRVLLVALAAASAVFAVLTTGREAVVAGRYRCPMHPEVMTPEPAACPVCGMALVLDVAPVSVAAAAPRTARATRRRFVEAVRAPAWVGDDGAVVAMMYRDDLVGLPDRQPAQFFPATAGSVALDVVLDREAGVGGWDDGTAQVTFDSAGRSPPPGSEGSLELVALPRDLLVVPSSAILDAPDGPYVLAIDPASRREVRRAVRIGRDHHGAIAVLHGLSEGDEVVIADAFFLAAERLLHPEAAP